MQAECLPEQGIQEVEFVSELAEIDNRIKGLVAFASLEFGPKAIEPLLKYPRVTGVRRMIKSEADPDFCLRPDFVKGVRALAQYGFSFALGIKPQHLLNAARLIELCPDVKFVVDHFAQPDIRRHKLDPWRHDLRRIAEFPNVFCKISSLATEADHLHWHIGDLQPYLEAVMEIWGPKRLMWGSDWPVSTQAMTIPQSVSVLEALFPGVIYKLQCHL